MDGMSATRAIRQYEQAYNVPRCCIVALTGLASNSARLEAWNSGIDHYMTKPVNFLKLQEFFEKEKARKAAAKEAQLATDAAPVSDDITSREEEKKPLEAVPVELDTKEVSDRLEETARKQELEIE